MSLLRVRLMIKSTVSRDWEIILISGIPRMVHLVLDHFVRIVGQVAIAGLLAQKKFIPESAGTLKTDTVTFAVMTFAVIFIVAALSFFPVHAF